MEKDVQKLKEQVSQLIAINRDTAGDIACMRLLISAMAQQIPNRTKLIKDFDEQVEDTAVRTMFSTMPEGFFEGLQNAASVWRSVLTME